MKVPYVSINNILLEWVEDTGIDLQHEEITENLLLRWATDCLRWIPTEEQLKHRIAILQVENSRSKLPEDFQLLAQAAAYPHYYHDPCDCIKDPNQDCCRPGYKPQYKYPEHYPKSRREDIVQWVQGTLEKDCELEINLVCPTCHVSDCKCTTPVVEVDVDRIWEMAHPEIYYRNFNRIGRVGYGPGPWTSYYNPKFKLMRYASNDYFNLKHILTECPCVDCVNCWHEFMIDIPYIEVDFQEGEVLLSYLGKPLDEKGDLMVPDHPSVFAAIFWHLEHKWFYRIYRRNSDKTALQKSELAEQKREFEIGVAKSTLQIPEFAQFKSWLEQNYYKRIPDYYHHENINKIKLDKAVGYDNLLKGKYPTR